jgi:hypothetical protein
MEATNMKNAQKTVDYQQEIDPHRFIRQVGKRPLLSQPKCKTSYEPELFAETFGPPEVEHRKRSCILFWNFADLKDGKAAFSMFAEFPAGQKTKDAKNVPVCLSARGSCSTAAYLWTADRLGAVENGDEAPLLLGAAKFVVSRVC